MLRTLFLVAFGGALAAASAAAGAKESALDTMLRDRVAGTPVDCINTQASGPYGLTIVDGTALVYRDGKTLYVNRTANPETLDRDDMLVIEQFGGSRLCRHDRVYTHDRTSGGRTGVVFLSEFVPYKKPD
jgi:hypothetical protein